MLSRRALLQMLPAAGMAAQGGRPPNVVVIFADDLGYGDVGCQGSKIRTPAIDGLAREGMRFTHGITANPVCSPSRAGLLTGRYPTRCGVPNVFFPRDEKGMNLDEQTLAELLKGRGYRTACVGKWHLGHHKPWLPTSRGFDRYFGIPYSNDMKPAWLMRDTEVIEETAEQTTLTRRYTEEAVKFIGEAGRDPFFLYMPHTFPHIPLYASPEFRGKSRHGIYGDVVEELDWSVGQVLGALKKAGAERNTLVLFSSDNGPWYQGSSGGLRGRKGMTWEGGVRVPFIVRWPGRVPRGRVCHSLVSTMDVVPTVTRLAGAAAPAKAVDGVDILPLLTGERAVLEREPVVYFHGRDVHAARWGNWKLHFARSNAEMYSAAPEGGRRSLRLSSPELYNLKLDPDESADVAAENPGVVEQMSAYVEKLMGGFPEDIQAAWRRLKETPVAPRPAGTFPAAAR
ncbi:MAG TPA: sulfatase [Bryobacteraceae bacterium]|nr:sulfatase [Bryobacterales bacterium]HRJ21097.1 sulfatase [Bryobacteraceae bacterium]